MSGLTAALVPGIAVAVEGRTAALVGSLQNEIGCAGDWDPACVASELVEVSPGVYQLDAVVPSGTYEYKVAMNDEWTESYGREGSGDNAPLVLVADTSLRFTFDDTVKRVSVTPLDLAGEYTAADDALVAAPVRQGTAEQFYFVMTDRFANGDVTNDTAAIAGGALDHGFDPTNKGFYQGGDIAGLRAQLDYIEGLGTTAIWLTPSFKNEPVQGTGADASAGYHGYWITDFTQIDPHLGTNAELEALIADAHTRGIKVYFDIITNHTSDGISYEEGTYSYVDQATTPYYMADGTTAFDPGTYAGTGTFPALDPALSFPYTPVAGDTVKVPAWLNNTTLYHNRGNSTWSGESTTFGDFDGLDDLMTEHPDVVNGFISVYETWMDLGIDGFRIDTVKHVNMEFWDEWTTAISEYAVTSGNPDFFMFGEVYDADPAKLSPYVRNTDMDSVLDFTYQSVASSWATGGGASALQRLFAGDDMYTTPQSSAAALPTFLGNHDMGRIGYMTSTKSDPLARSEVAHSLMYLTRGQPVVYYGDEQGFIGAGDGKDKNARQTLFGSQVTEYNAQTVLDGTAMGDVVDVYPTGGPLYTHISALAALRSSTPALATGAQIELLVDGGVYAFARVDRTEQIEHLVALNNAAAADTVQITTLTPGATYTALYGTHAPVVASAAGVVEVTVPAFGAVVLVANAPVAAAGVDTLASVSLPVAGAKVMAGLVPVTADVADNRWQETSFAYRVVGQTAWTPLGTAETDIPRVYQDLPALPVGTLVEYRAVSVDAAGNRSAASTYASYGVDVSLVVPTAPEPDPEPGYTSVAVAGSHNSEMGCVLGDWAPACPEAELTQRADGVWTKTFADLPAGDYQFKVAMDDAWTLNYGLGGVRDGANAAYTHAGGPITFYFDPVTKYFFNTSMHPVMTVPGSYQSQVGCTGNWMPDCLATMLTDLDGDGIFTYATSAIPEGSYEGKVAHGMGWDENYGVGGVPNGPNYTFTAPGGGKLVVFSYDPITHLMTIEVTDPPLAGLGQYQAHWIDANTIAWPTSLVPAGSVAADLTWSLHHAPDASLEVVDGAVVGAAAVPLTLVAGGLTAEQLARFPALAGYLALTLDGVAPGDVKDWLTGELAVSQVGGGDVAGAATAITGLQIPGVLDDLYAGVATDGAYGPAWSYGGVPTLSVWAPTATDVNLLLWAGGDTSVAPNRIDMVAAADGSWSVLGQAGWEDAAYRYEVTVYAPSLDEVVVNEVTDPASLGLTLNSTHSVLVDLDDPRWAPDAWAAAAQPVVEPVDQTIYELHVRDFSISDATVPAELRGTYGAFAYEGSGRAHLRSLAEAGLTTVHLLPTFDIATIEEDRAAQVEPPCDLPTFAPDSTEQQACIDGIRDQDGYNWGYDPLHWTTPEGSYAVEANGGTRTAEFRSMVGALHQDNLQVVLDQVFNHTSNSGQDAKSILDRIVPGYYHRLNVVGSVETSTCCQNIATEHLMAEKLMVDSVVTWARDYKVDGFRFDLMGHHSVENMAAIRAGLDALTVAQDGVDGSAVYLYGEGWNFGEVANNARFTQASQGQLDGTGIGTFSDRLRDAVRGGGPFDEDPRKQGFGSGLSTDPNGAATNGTPEQQAANLAHQTDLVRLGLAGNLADYSLLASDGQVSTGAELDYNGQPAGYAQSPEEIITYVDAHDNETIWDALTLKLPTDTSMADRVRMNTLSLATTALAQTPSFWHAGADLLRSKSLDRNSYNSGDWFNGLDFTGQDNGFGRGLPPAADNEAKWEFQQPLLANPALAPTAQDIAAASGAAADLLELRFSTDLFRLGDADLIQQKVTFPGSGPDADPGVIVMHVDDTIGTDVDPELDGLLVVFNASAEEITVAVDGLAGARYMLSPVLAGGSDATVRDTTWDPATGTVTVPARTVTALVDAEPLFTDVADSHPFYTEIEWLVGSGITTGYSDGAFRPTVAVSRQAMVTWMYRLEHAGAQAPACTTAPFSDVPIDSPFCGEIAWAAAQGITNGYSDGTFGPTNPVTRRAGAAYLYRLANGSATAPACTTAPFPDVPVGSSFCGEIAWLAAQGITTGYEDGMFGPGRAVSRQAMAAWLYRYNQMVG